MPCSQGLCAGWFQSPAIRASRDSWISAAEARSASLGLWRLTTPKAEWLSRPLLNPPASSAAGEPHRATPHPAGVDGPGAMKAQDPWAEIPRSTGAAAPALNRVGRAGAAEQSLDAAARNKRPAAGTDHRADDPFINAAVADQSPVDLGLHDVKACSVKGDCSINALHPLINPLLDRGTPARWGILGFVDVLPLAAARHLGPDTPSAPVAASRVGAWLAADQLGLTRRIQQW